MRVALWATISMKVEFDPHKSERCFESRGFDFEYVAHIFLDANRLIEEDLRYDYGEHRYSVLGQIDGRLYAVTYTLRESDTFRIISARKANKREVKRYEKFNSPS